MAKIHGAHPDKPTGIKGILSRPVRPGEDPQSVSLVHDPEVAARSGERELLVRIVRRRKTSMVGNVAEGGMFSPHGNTTTSADGKTVNFDPQPVVEAQMVSGLGPNSDLTSFLHEFGHFIDTEYSGRIGTFAFAEGAIQMDQAAMELIVAATRTPSFNQQALRLQSVDPQYFSYWVDAVEIWARLYAQWAAFRLRDERPDVWKQMLFDLKKAPDTGWTLEEFEELIPLIENFLRVRGLMT